MIGCPHKTNVYIKRAFHTFEIYMSMFADKSHFTACDIIISIKAKLFFLKSKVYELLEIIWSDVCFWETILV